MPKLTKLRRYQLQSIEHINAAKARQRRAFQPVDQNIAFTESEVGQSESGNNTINVNEDVHGKNEIINKETTETTNIYSVDENNRSDIVTNENNMLQIEFEQAVNPNPKKYGRRIVDIDYFVKQLLEISTHGPLGCTSKELELQGEKQNGLISTFTFRCKMCNVSFYIKNDCGDDNYSNINTCAVAGAIAIGCGQAQLEEFLACLNLPTLQYRTYRRNHQLISKHWEEVALATMKEAAQKEKEIAMSEGRLNKDGIAIVDVKADGCWSKRSYKKNYSALSGAAAIIGKNTGKILYLGIRNKYCQVCARAERDKVDTKDHLCFKNYDGPSTGMESQILIEGFKQSVEEHALIYGRLISDGDSSTYAKILEVRPYPDVTVEKVECRNHLLRNFCNKLHALKTDTKYPIKHRKLVSKKTIFSTRAAICKSIKWHKDNSDIQLLFYDLLLCHLHAFGDHTNCKSYFCDKIGTDDVSKPSQDFFLSSLWQKICHYVHELAAHARSLSYDVDSNAVENFHSIVAKFVGGKRINFSKKNSYNTRCLAAAVACNEKKTVSRLYKSMNQNKSPKGKLATLERQRIKKNIINKKYKKAKKRLFTQNPSQNNDYGINCTKPDMDLDVLDRLKEHFLAKQHKTDEERNEIEKKTILQGGSSEWLELRRSLLTASNFGRVIKMRPDTTCANLVKELLYKNNLDNVLSIKHGRENEKVALQQLSKEKGINITPCGLFIDKSLPYLGATPDGVCGEDMIIEVKCPITANKTGIAEAIQNKKITFWKKDQKGGLKINKTHNWFYQVQGQLHVTNRPKCLFAVWANEKEPLKTEIILRDDKFWKEKMEAKLTAFYTDCILPELLDPRHPRNLPIRNPQRIQEAIENRKKQKPSKCDLDTLTANSIP